MNILGEICTEQWHDHPAIRNLQDNVDLAHNCGYVTFVDIGVVDFGCPNRHPVLRLEKSTKATKQGMLIIEIASGLN